VTFQVFAKEGCVLCQKARDVLEHVGVTAEVRYVDGPHATVENLADFAWYDWTDKPPLVVAVESGRLLQRWDGRDIEAAWTPRLREWLAGQGWTGTAAGTQAGPAPVQ